MKKFNIISVLFVLVLFSLKSNAQQTDENTLIINRYFQSLNSEQILLTENNLKYAQSDLNTPNSTEINILQSGNFNNININSSANNQSIGQVGNYNSYEFISFYGRDDLNFEAQQIGENNLIQILGENSLINNMKIIQKSDFKTITITNY